MGKAPTGEELSGEEMVAQAAAQINSQLAGVVDEDADAPAPDEHSEVEETDEDQEADGVGESEEEVEDDDVYADLSEDQLARKAQAEKEGWKPLAQWKGPEGKWKDFDDFLEVGDRIASRLTGKVDRLTAENQKQQEMIKKLIAAQGKIVMDTRKQVLAELKTARVHAIQSGDVELVEQLDNEIKEQTVADAEVEKDFKVDEAPATDQAVVDFVEAEKSWFNKDNEKMVRFAIAQESIQREVDPDADSEVIMARVKKSVVDQFPDKFPAKQVTRQSRRSGGGEGGAATVRSTSTTVRFADYPEEVRAIARQFAKDGVMTEAEYLQALKSGDSK